MQNQNYHCKNNKRARWHYVHSAKTDRKRPWLRGAHSQSLSEVSNPGGQAVDAGPFRFTRAGNVQGSNSVHAQPGNYGECVARVNTVISLQNQARFAQLLREDFCGVGTVAQFTNINDQRAVAVCHISAGSLPVAAISDFGELVLQGDGAVLCCAPAWRPATVDITMQDCKIQSCAISPRLTARNDLLAKADRFLVGISMHGKRLEVADALNFSALINSMIGVFNGFFVNHAIGATDLLLQPLR